MNTEFLKRIQLCNFYKYFNEKIQLLKVEIFGMKYIHTNSIYDIIQLFNLQMSKESFEYAVRNYKRFCEDYNHYKYKFEDCSENILHMKLREKFKKYPQVCNLTYENYFKYITDIIDKCKAINSENSYSTSEILCINDGYTKDKILSGIYIPDWSLIAFIHFLTHEYNPEFENFKESIY